MFVYNGRRTAMATPQEIEVPSWSARLAHDLAASDQSAQALLTGFTKEQLNWQPAPGSWSIGQCIEHLCLTNEAYISAIAAALQGQPDAPVDKIAPGWFSRWFIRSFVEPSAQTKRASAPPKIQPTARVEPSVLDRFLSGNRSCRELMVKARTTNVNCIRFQNPFLPLLRFTVGTAFELIAGHERRHLLQAERVRDSASFPGSHAKSS